MTSSRVYSSPLSRFSLATTASRSCSVPATAVYFVNPSRIAWIAASLTCFGVSKSGSPPARLMTSMPSACICFARAVRARVDEGLMLRTRRDRAMYASLPFSQFTLAIPLPEHPLHNWRHQALHGAAEQSNLLDQPRAQVGIGFVGHQEDRLDVFSDPAIHEGHLELVLEIRDGPEAADHDGRPLRLHIVHKEGMKGIDPDPLHVPHRIPDDFHPLLEREEGGLFGIAGDRHDHPGKDL